LTAPSTLVLVLRYDIVGTMRRELRELEEKELEDARCKVEVIYIASKQSSNEDVHRRRDSSPNGWKTN
jgi:hypothetical protein